MMRRPPSSTLFPYTPLFRSLTGDYPSGTRRSQIPRSRGCLARRICEQIGRAPVSTPVTPRKLVCRLFFLNDAATTELYPLSLHAALPISHGRLSKCHATFANSAESRVPRPPNLRTDRKSTRLNSRHPTQTRMPPFFFE